MIERVVAHLRLVISPEGEATDVLRTNLRVDTNIDLLGAAVVFSLAVWLDSTGGMIYAGIIAAITLVRTLAFRAYRANDITRGLLIVVISTWAVAFPGVFLTMPNMSSSSPNFIPRPKMLSLNFASSPTASTPQC